MSCATLQQLIKLTAKWRKSQDRNHFLIHADRLWLRVIDLVLVQSIELRHEQAKAMNVVFCEAGRATG
jgi:hypothetical protein